MVLLLLASYIGLTSVKLPHVNDQLLNDKLLHLLTFFLLTVSEVSYMPVTVLVTYIPDLSS